jgi:repressor of nif and glnA expression
VKRALPLVFTLSRIENLMHQVSFDPDQMSGSIITNTTRVDKKHLQETIAVFFDAISAGLAVSPLIMVEEEERWIKLKTACSLTVSGVMLKHGIPVRPKGGGLIEVVGRKPTRFTDMLMYWATTVDPIDLLTAQGMTDIAGMMRTGNGRILGNLQEAPFLARERIEELLEQLSAADFAGILELGDPNMDVLGVSVERDHVGIALVGGTNLVAAAQEAGIPVEHESISDLTEVSLMNHIDELI